MEFRQEYWSVLPFPIPGDLPDLGIEPESLLPPALAGESWPLVPPGKCFGQCVCVLSCFSCVWVFVILWTVARQTPLSMGFSRQGYWSGLPRPPPRDLPYSGNAPASHVSCVGRQVFTTSAAWEAPWTRLLFSHLVMSNSLWPYGLQASLSFTFSWSLLKLMSIELLILFSHLILCRPLFLLPSIFPSIKVFSNELVLQIRWPEYWDFSFSISPSNEYSGLISFRTDWLPQLAVQGILKSLLQQHSSKASVLWHSAYFMVQLSHLYLSTGNTTALTEWTFVRKMFSLPFNMLPRFGIAFLSRSKYLLISWLQSPSSVILEPNKIKPVAVSIFPHLFVMKWWNQMLWS